MKDSGFTLIEVLVVASITALITSFLIANFSQSRLGLDRAMNAMVADIRDAQLKAVTSSRFNGNLRCGFGVHYVSPTLYRIYTSQQASADCASDDRKYGPTDPTVRDVAIDLTVNFQNAFTDIFFEPPNPTTWIDGAQTGVSTILIRRNGVDCLSSLDTRRDCRVICVYATGRIDSAAGSNCP